MVLFNILFCMNYEIILIINQKNYILLTLINNFRLLKNFSSNSYLHKEMLAILAALTEVIKANGGKESSTEYFAALVSRHSVILSY